MSLTVAIIVILFCILSEGFFSGVEIAVVSFNRITLKHKIKQGYLWAKRVEHLLEQPERLLGTTLLGTNLATVVASTIATIYLTLNWGEEYQFISFLVMSPLILVFGEILPKMLFHRNAKFILPWASAPIYWLGEYLFRPVVATLSIISQFILKILGKDGDVNPFLTREELKTLLDTDGRDELANSDVNTHERRMINRIFKFSKTTASRIMKPLIEVVAVSDDQLLDTVIDVVNEKRFSRLPVFKQRIDNIIGVVNGFDLLRAPIKEKKIKELVRKVRYITENQLVDQLLMQMQKDGEHMVIVVDEYGGAVGIVTVEDILEEIVGDIEDEHDIAPKMYHVIRPGCIRVNGRIEVDIVNEMFKLEIPLGDYETIAGFIIHHTRRIPKLYDTVTHQENTFKIIKVTSRSIDEVEITYGVL